jgi:hypothetical protein
MKCVNSIRIKERGKHGMARLLIYGMLIMLVMVNTNSAAGYNKGVVYFQVERRDIRSCDQSIDIYVTYTDKLRNPIRGEYRIDNVPKKTEVQYIYPVLDDNKYYEIEFNPQFDIMEDGRQRAWTLTPTMDGKTKFEFSIKGVSIDDGLIRGFTTTEPYILKKCDEY